MGAIIGSRPRLSVFFAGRDYREARMRTVKVLAAGALVALALAACSSGKGGGAASGNGSDAAANSAKAGDQFKQLWKNQVGILVRYTVARGAGDQAGAAKAKQDLTAYQSQFATFMAGVAPKLPKQVVASDAKQRLAGMVAAVDATATHSQQQAANQFAAVYEHMFSSGATLAAATGAAPSASKATALRSTIDMQLGEQAALTTLVLDKAVTGAPDAKAYGAVLGKNTQALTQSIGSVYGRPAGSKIKSLW